MEYTGKSGRKSLPQGLINYLCKTAETTVKSWQILPTYVFE